MARSILSFGMFSCRAAITAARRRGFIAGSGVPSFAATVISRASLPNSFDFWASWRPLRCMMFLNWEWPAMRVLWGVRAGDLDWKGGLIGPRPAEIKDWATFSVLPQGKLPPKQAFVNHHFTARWEDDAIVFHDRATSWRLDCSGSLRPNRLRPNQRRQSRLPRWRPWKRLK